MLFIFNDLIKKVQDLVSGKINNNKIIDKIIKMFHVKHFKSKNILQLDIVVKSLYLQAFIVEKQVEKDNLK